MVSCYPWGGVTVALLSSGKPYRLIRSLSFAVACYSSGYSVPFPWAVGDYAPHSLCSVVRRPSILTPSSGMMPQRETLCLPPVWGCRSASLLVGTISLMKRTTIQNLDVRRRSLHLVHYPDRGMMQFGSKSFSACSPPVRGSASGVLCGFLYPPEVKRGSLSESKTFRLPSSKKA